MSNRFGFNADARRTLPPMRRFLLPGFLVLGLVLPAQAQRGGGARGGGGAGGHVSGGFRGGFSAPSGGAFRGAPARAMAPGSAAYRYGPRPGYSSATAFRRPAYGVYPRANTAGRPAFYNRAGSAYSLNRRGDYRLPWRNRWYGYGYGYPGFYSAGLFYNPFFFDPFFGLGDPFWDYGDPYWDSGYASAPDAGYADDSYAQQQQPAEPEANQPYPAQPADGYAPSPDTEPGPWAPQMYRQPASAALRQEASVTIVFKDGRPPEHVRNYALTRTALLVTGQQLREIPLDEIDLAATQQINRAAGVDFQLPHSY